MKRREPVLNIVQIFVVYSGVSSACKQNVPQSSLDERLPNEENGENIDGDGSQPQHP